MCGCGFFAWSYYHYFSPFQLPNQSQDVLLRLALTVLISYVANAHMALYAIHPALSALPSLICLIVAYFVWKLAQHRAHLQALRVGAQPMQKDVSETNEIDSDDYKLSDSEIDEDAHSHQKERQRENRRESIIAGLRVLQAGIKQQEQQQSDSSKLSSSLGLSEEENDADSGKRADSSLSPSEASSASSLKEIASHSK